MPFEFNIVTQCMENAVYVYVGTLNLIASILNPSILSLIILSSVSEYMEKASLVG